MKQMEDEIADAIGVWLGTTQVGCDVRYLMAFFDRFVATKPHLQQRVADYSKNKAAPWRVSHEWLRLHLHQWGFSFRVATTVARKEPPNVLELWEDFIGRLAFTVARDLPRVVMMKGPSGERVPVERIPPELVLNFDQTGIAPISFRKASWAKTGSKDVPLEGQDDKRQMTAVVGSNAAGEGAPFQIVMQGKTDRCVHSGWEWVWVSCVGTGMLRGCVRVVFVCVCCLFFLISFLPTSLHESIPQVLAR